MTQNHLGAIQLASLWRTSPGYLIPDLIGPLDLENKVMGIAGFTWTISGNKYDEICIGELGRKRGQQRVESRVAWEGQARAVYHLTVFQRLHLVLPWDDVCLWNAGLKVGKEVSLTTELSGV